MCDGWIVMTGSAVPGICEQEHRVWPQFEDLPFDQGGRGRHKCAGCAYDRGHVAGYDRREALDLDLDALPYSQAGTVRHRSVHAAFALGYLDGVGRWYRERGQ